MASVIVRLALIGCAACFGSLQLAGKRGLLSTTGPRLAACAAPRWKWVKSQELSKAIDGQCSGSATTCSGGVQRVAVA
jgi:hypothetical protein